MKDEALRWLREARWDLDTASMLHRGGRYNAASFYAHQAAEKAAKALLYSLNEAPWGHSVRVLLERFYERKGRKADEKIIAYARELDRHYISSRYPNAHPDGTPHEAYDAFTSERAIKAAKEIIKFVEGEAGWMKS